MNTSISVKVYLQNAMSSLADVMVVPSGLQAHGLDPPKVPEQQGSNFLQL